MNGPAVPGPTRLPYYGWIIVGVATLSYVLVFGTSMAAFGLFVHPVSAEFRLNRAQISTALIFISIGNAAVAPVLGWAADRFPARRIYLSCVVLFGLSMAILSASASLLIDAVVLGVMMPFGLLGAGSLTLSVLVARWFEAQRGRAMAIAGAGLYLGNILVTPLVGLVIQAAGWRLALLLIAAGVTALLGLFGLLIRDAASPGHAAAVHAHGSPAAGHASIRQIVSAPQFWLIGIRAGLGFAIIQTVSVSLVTLGVETGLSIVQAASITSMIGGGSLAGALLLAIFADRIRRVHLLTGVLAAAALLNAALHFLADYQAIMAAAATLGIVSGILTPTVFTFVADRFGAASFGTARGLTIPLTAVIQAGVVSFGSTVFDRSGSYTAMFDAFAVALVLAAVMMFAVQFCRTTVAADRPAWPAS